MSNVMISDDAKVEVGDNEFDDMVRSGVEDGDEFEKKIALRIKKKDVDEAVYDGLEVLLCDEMAATWHAPRQVFFSITVMG